MRDEDIRRRLERKELELNSLLEITQAINANEPDDKLYKMFNFTLRPFGIRKLALFVFDDVWTCKANFGTRTSFLTQQLDERFLMVRNVHYLREFDGECAFHEFDLVIPVTHKNSSLAMVFIAGLEIVGTPAQDENIRYVQALSNIIMVAIENKKLARRQLEQEAFRKELEIASDVQQFLFPEKLPNTERLKIEASYLPHDRVGGDYYDYIPINRNQFLICVADVSGKGIPAALMMSNFQASLRTLLRQTPNITEIVQALNIQVLENTKGENFITFFGAIYDIELKTLIYVNAGHNPPILWDRKHGIRLLEEGSTVLGALDPLPFIHEGFITGLDDFLMFCYTDGLTETVNEAGADFGQQAILDYLASNHHKDLSTIHQDIIVQLDGFKGRNSYHDDITILSCRVGPNL
ncbi:MAG: PP2C family protein-serine/threonine phosphatase [Cyclobacteriaceae bacterium]|nr:PP2C family protein-serine/threonine phosphatase [Cyclobacteriaceae bacterium]